ncbi:hypothetical protein M9H77_16444 [Catharanthus roseus]|uniref:Uncharacterized protein n=1 Tax=Catharanthus roseus TaxID=4058 RepID=A0ACC0B1T1_CATRO|nr:hypothetical protein M9H77_16444 [Catharanthus roseus]
MTLNYQAMNIISCALDANEYNRVNGCDSAHEMWKLLEVTHEDSSKSEGKEKANLCFMALENEVQSSPSNLSNLVDDDDDDDDLNSLLIEMYHELEKITKKSKELKTKIDNLSNKNSKNLFVKTKLSLNLLKF